MDILLVKSSVLSPSEYKSNGEISADPRYQWIGPISLVDTFFSAGSTAAMLPASPPPVVVVGCVDCDTVQVNVIALPTFIYKSEGPEIVARASGDVTARRTNRMVIVVALL